MKGYKKLNIKLGSSLMVPRDCYNSGLLSEIISENDFMKLLLEAEKIISYSIIKKKKYDQIETPNFIYFLSFIILISWIINFIFAYYAPRKKNPYLLYLFSIIFTVIGFVLLLFLIFYNLSRKIEKGKVLAEFIDEDLKDYFNRIKMGDKLFFTYNKKQKIIECFINVNYISERAIFEKSEHSSSNLSQSVEKQNANEINNEDDF